MAIGPYFFVEYRDFGNSRFRKAFLGLLYSNIRIPFVPTGETMVPFHDSKVTSRLVEFAGLNLTILSSTAIVGTLSHMDWA